MDFFVKHWGAYPRHFPSRCPLLTMGDVRDKDEWVRSTFNTCNFSIILRGRGEYFRKEKIWGVRAPFMITQWPGDEVEYGPPLPEETWDELYLIYDARCMTYFRERGFVEENRPAWPIYNLEGVMAQVDELRTLGSSRNPERVADRVDVISERLILESLLPGVKPASDTGDEVIQHIILHLRSHLEENHDFEQLARQHGLSASTLRRRWHEALKTTPGRYLLNLRMQKARRLLAETTHQVGEIAAESGFEDMLYFSRRFKLETGLTPSQYRRDYRIKSS